MQELQFFGMPMWRENIDSKSYNKKEIINSSYSMGTRLGYL